jgi:hypothetical protein
VTFAAMVDLRRGVTYPLALRRAAARGSPAARAMATPTAGRGLLNASTTPVTTTIAPSPAANSPRRFPPFPVGRKRSSILSEAKSGAGALEAVLIKKETLLLPFVKRVIDEDSDSTRKATGPEAPLSFHFVS